jgi:dethiobiotin synthetase
MTAFVVTGTDTDVGKTIFSAALAAAIGAFYWKPVQAGDEGGGDAERVASLSDLPAGQILGEAYRLRTPCSPHRAAEIDGIEIEPTLLVPPTLDPLVIEGAGGALVPLSRTMLFADLFAIWDLPTIVVARTVLGTINHSLLTIEALRGRGVPILGVAFVGDPVEDSEATISELGRVRRLGRLPWLGRLDRGALAEAFAANFRVQDFR